MSETVVSSVVRVTGHARPVQAGERMGRDGLGTIPACQFEVGHRSSVTPARDQLGAQRRVVDGARSVGDPLRARPRARAGPAPRRPTRRRGS